MGDFGYVQAWDVYWDFDAYFGPITVRVTIEHDKQNYPIDSWIFATLNGEECSGPKNDRPLPLDLAARMVGLPPCAWGCMSYGIQCFAKVDCNA